MVYIFGIAVVLILWRLFKGAGDESGSSSKGDMGLASWDGIQIDREWWPRIRRIGSEEFEVRTKDPEKTVRSDVFLERWWHRESMGSLYLITMEHGVTLDYQESNLDKFRMRKKYQKAEEDGRLFVAWSLSFHESDRSNAYNMTLDVFEIDRPFPMRQPKGSEHYVHPNSWNAMVKKTQDPEELATMMEAKMAENAAKG